jgi:hypothetical protein
MRVFHRSLNPGRSVYDAIVYTSTGSQSFVVSRHSVTMFDRDTDRLCGVSKAIGGSLKSIGNLSQRAVFIGSARSRIINKIMPIGDVS